MKHDWIGLRLTYGIIPCIIARHIILVYLAVTFNTEHTLCRIVYLAVEVGILQLISDDFFRVSVPDFKLFLHPRWNFFGIRNGAIVHNGKGLPWNISYSNIVDCLVQILVICKRGATLTCIVGGPDMHKPIDLPSWHLLFTKKEIQKLELHPMFKRTEVIDVHIQGSWGSISGNKISICVAWKSCPLEYEPSQKR